LKVQRAKQHFIYKETFFKTVEFLIKKLAVQKRVRLNSQTAERKKDKINTRTKKSIDQ
jgi:hypothetical protein